MESKGNGAMVRVCLRASKVMFLPMVGVVVYCDRGPAPAVGEGGVGISGVWLLFGERAPGVVIQV